MRRIRAERPVEFWVALITAASVVFIGVEQGILLAMVLSLLAHTRHGYKAKNMVLEAKGDHFYAIPLDKAVQTLPGLVAYRFNHSMYYANSAAVVRGNSTSVPVGTDAGGLALH